MDLKAEVIGLGALNKDLSALAEKMHKKALEPLLKPGAKQMQQAVKQRTPLRTGSLCSAVKVKAGKGKATEPYANMLTHIGKIGKKFERSGRWGSGIASYGFFIHNGVVQYSTKRNKRKGAHSAANRDKALARHGWRIKPEPFVYEAFEANVEQVATSILNRIDDSL